MRYVKNQDIVEAVQLLRMEKGHVHWSGNPSWLLEALFGPNPKITPCDDGGFLVTSGEWVMHLNVGDWLVRKSVLVSHSADRHMEESFDVMNSFVFNSLYQPFLKACS